MFTCTECGVALARETVSGKCEACETKTISRTAANTSPDSIPGYELLELLGRGGMGEVHRARQRSLDRFVAIKVIHPQKGTDPTFTARFEREARLLARLTHPHIVAIHEFGEYAGHLYLVMELLEGRTARSLLQGNKPPPATAIEIVRQLCEGVGYAHQQGIVHRDIKPENVLLDSTGRVKIADFGLARLVQPDSVNQALTQSGAIMGTFRYMAPEQLAGDAEIDARADVYSLGIMLYELLTGVVPQGNFPPPSHRAVIDPRLDTVVLRALAFDRSDRYASAIELQQALAEATGPKAQEERIAIKGSLAETAEQPKPLVGRIPQPPTRLIGREQELAELIDLCRSQRLVTLLGPGGTGKTRLALEVARTLAADWPHGVWFVELAEVSAADLIAPTIARTLQLKEAGDSVETLLLAHVRERQLLLVLDNCEQALGVATLVAKLLEAGPGLRVLVTSRIPLRVRGEHEYPVSPLALPQARPEGNTPESITESPAVRLFVERAQGVRPDFRLTPENGAAVVEICRRLDGLPLALELAAARLRLFTPEALAPRLANSLKLLTGGSKDLPERQRTLRGAIAWSYNLLAPGEQALFRWLSVFSGDFALESAEEVCGPLAERDDAVEFLDGLSALVEQSLVRAAPDEGRFEMLVTLREYAAKELATSGDEEAARGALVRWGMKFLEAAAPHFDTAAGPPWLKRLEAEWVHVRSVLQFLAPADPRAALELAASTWYGGYQIGRLAETRDRLTTLLDWAGNEPPTAARATAAHGAGTLCWTTGRVDEAWKLFGEALAIRRQLGDAVPLAATLNNMGVLAREQADYAAAERYHTEAMTLRRTVGNPAALATSLANVGLLASDLGDTAKAREYMTEALVLYRELGDEQKSATVLGNLGRSYMQENRPEESRTCSLEALAIHEKMGNARGQILALLALAATDSMAGNLLSSQAAAERALREASELGDAWLVTYAKASLGFVAERRQDWTAALDLYRDSLRRREELGDLGGQGEILERLAAVFHEFGQDTVAVRLLGAEDALQRRVGYARFPQFHATSLAIREAYQLRYGVEALGRELAAGAGLSHEEAVRLALADVHEHEP